MTHRGPAAAGPRERPPGLPGVRGNCLLRRLSPGPNARGNEPGIELAAVYGYRGSKERRTTGAGYRQLDKLHSSSHRDTEWKVHARPVPWKPTRTR
eukprot:764138-Hanusia_phi.AAC.10